MEWTQRPAPIANATGGVGINRAERFAGSGVNLALVVQRICSAQSFPTVARAWSRDVFRCATPRSPYSLSPIAKHFRSPSRGNQGSANGWGLINVKAAGPELSHQVRMPKHDARLQRTFAFLRLGSTDDDSPGLGGSRRGPLGTR